jgi:hypothetical protein
MPKVRSVDDFLDNLLHMRVGEIRPIVGHRRQSLRVRLSRQRAKPAHTFERAASFDACQIETHTPKRG